MGGTCGSCSGKCCGCCSGRLFARSHEPSDRFTNGNDSSDLCSHSGKDPVARSLDFDDGLVRFDFKKRLAFADAIAFVFSPSQEFAIFLRHFQSGHYHADRHNVFRAEKLIGRCHSFMFSAGRDHVPHMLAGRRLVFPRRGERPIDREVVRTCNH